MTNLFIKSQPRRQFVRQTLLSVGGLLLTSVARALDNVGRTGLDAGELDRTLGAFGHSIHGHVLLASDVHHYGMLPTLILHPHTQQYLAITVA